MQGTDPVQRRDVIQMELVKFRLCLNLTWFELFDPSLFDDSEVPISVRPFNTGF